MPAPLWQCPDCRRTFANRNQTHTCALGDLDAHFANTDAIARELFDAFAARVRACGPVTILPEKTRIAFHVRMSFAALMPRRRHLAGHFVLARRVEHPRFPKVHTISPRNHVHHFRIETMDDVDALQPFLEEAYAVGEQQHLTRPGH